MTREPNSIESNGLSPLRLPVLPLASAVLFPDSILSVRVSASSIAGILSDPMKGSHRLIALFQSTVGSGGQPVAQLAKVGVSATVIQSLEVGDDRVQLLLKGGERVSVRELIDEDPERPLQAVVDPIVEVSAPSPALQRSLIDKAIFVLKDLAEVDGRYSDDVVGVARSSIGRGASHVADLIASYLNVPLEERYGVLQTIEPVARLERVIEILQRDLHRATLDRDLEQKAHLSLSRRDRDRYLREQIRLIQEELGDSTPESETEDFISRVDVLPIDDDWKQALRREAVRMGQLPPGSSDYSVVRGHLDTVIQMPWTASTPDRIDLAEAEALLERNHHGLKEVKERVLEFLAVVKLKGDLRGPILCFTGPPGVGKTSLGESIADALGRKFIRISVGGMSDESEIRGHRKTYVGAMPGKIVNSYLHARVNNPLIMIDEIDKIGMDFRGDPASSLLEVLDPQQNRRFVDRYLEVPFDLSQTLFIVTANVLDEIPIPLRDRLEVIRLAGYAENEKLQIARLHLVPEILAEHGLSEDLLVIEDEAMLTIIRDYTAEAGVRELSRKIAAVARKSARAVASGDAVKTTLTSANLTDLLGMPLYEHEFAQRAPEIGVATGLAWTSVGGEILFIEATRMEGTGKTTVTGHLGDVMKESVQTAYSYVRSRSRELGITEEAFERSDLHVHFPAGSIPKDGPSAGVTVATTIASLMAERAVRHDVAMTGEITLRGKVLSVGGIKEKVIAARRAHIKKIILPMGNRKDLAEVADEVKSDLRFVFAERVEDVWDEALIPLYIVNPERRRKYDEAEFEADKARDTGRDHT